MKNNKIKAIVIYENGIKKNIKIPIIKMPEKYIEINLIITI